jgi:hypothetical protein
MKEPAGAGSFYYTLGAIIKTGAYTMKKFI